MRKWITYLWTGLLFACLSGCKEDAVQVPQDQIVKLSTESDISALKADGLSVINLKAVIPANTLAASRTVTFSATAGLGSFAGSSAANTNVVTADQDGIARTSLIVSKTAGTYYVSAQVTSGGQTYRTTDLQVITLPLAASDKLVLKVDNSAPAADALTTVNITITAKYRSDKAVKLTANYGTFPQASDLKNLVVNLDDQGNGVALFQMSNQLQPHIITGAFTTDGTTVSINVNPVISRPDTVLLESTATRFDTIGTAVPLSIYLRKIALNAKVTQGTTVNINAYQIIGGVKKNVGRFTGQSNALSDGNGNVTGVSYFGDTGDVDTKQDITIEVSTLKTATLSTTAQLRLKLKGK